MLPSEIPAPFGVDPSQWQSHISRQVNARPEGFAAADWDELVAGRLREQAESISRTAEAHRVATSDLDSGLRPIDHNDIMIARLKARNQRGGYGLGRGAPLRPGQIFGR